MQIETVEALQALDAIVNVKGIDSLVRRAADLSGAMGLPGQLTHPRVLEAIQLIATKARQAGLFTGIGMGPNVDYAVQVAGLGVQWIQCGGDCLHGPLHRARCTRTFAAG